MGLFFCVFFWFAFFRDLPDNGRYLLDDKRHLQMRLHANSANALLFDIGLFFREMHFFCGNFFIRNFNVPWRFAAFFLRNMPFSRWFLQVEIAFIFEAFLGKNFFITKHNTPWSVASFFLDLLKTTCLFQDACFNWEMHYCLKYGAIPVWEGQYLA